MQLHNVKPKKPAIHVPGFGMQNKMLNKNLNADLKQLHNNLTLTSNSKLECLFPYIHNPYAKSLYLTPMLNQFFKPLR